QTSACEVEMSSGKIVLETFHSCAQQAFALGNLASRPQGGTDVDASQREGGGIRVTGLLETVDGLFAELDRAPRLAAAARDVAEGIERAPEEHASSAHFAKDACRARELVVGLFEPVGLCEQVAGEHQDVAKPYGPDAFRTFDQGDGLTTIPVRLGETPQRRFDRPSLGEIERDLPPRLSGLGPVYVDGFLDRRE